MLFRRTGKNQQIKNFSMVETKNDEKLIKYYNSTDRDIHLARELIEILEIETNLELSNRVKNIIVNRVQKISSEYTRHGTRRTAFRIYEGLKRLDRETIEFKDIKQIIDRYGSVEEFERELNKSKEFK